MKRRRRYGERYEGIPYPDSFKKKVLAAFPDDEEKRKAVEEGWECIGRWFGWSILKIPCDRILSYLSRGEQGIKELRLLCEEKVRRQQVLQELDDGWQRIIFLDDHGCRPWEDEEAVQLIGRDCNGDRCS